VLVRRKTPGLVGCFQYLGILAFREYSEFQTLTSGTAGRPDSTVLYMSLNA
jgi:hypothetical protein